MICRRVDEKRAFVEGKGIAGIDVAHGWHYIRWLTPAGRFVGRAVRVKNNAAGFAHLPAARTAPEVVVGIESTEPYGVPLAHWLEAQPGVTVVPVNPAHVKRARELDDTAPTESDPKDAGVIARLVAEGRFLSWTAR